MCDSYTLTADLSELQTQFLIDQVSYPFKPQAQAAPTQQVAIILNEGGIRRLEQARWGLVPFWAKDAVNADSEWVQEKRAYRRLFARQRCVIPCSGFYGWKQEGKVKQSIHIGLRHKKLFGIAGLYEIWKDHQGVPYRTCTLITTSSHRMMEEYNVRLPAILDEQGIEIWTNPDEKDTDLLQAQLRPYHADLMFAYPASVGKLQMNARAIGFGLEDDAELEELPAKYAMIKK